MTNPLAGRPCEVLRPGRVISTGRNGVATQPTQSRTAERPDPAAGGEDGILTAEELAALDLRGVDLVALSACDTGRGKVAAGEGVFGLRRAIEIAGARSTLMSLWPVPDRPSSSFMTRFYRSRLAGTPAQDAARDAAREALRELRQREQPEHPYLWAGFVTAGDWN